VENQNQHYVPKFLLRNFVDSDGRVFCLNKKTDVTTKSPPKNAGSRAGFNEFLIEGERVSFEERFQKIETRAALAFQNIVSRNSLSVMSDRDRQSISDFVAVQSFRTEAFREGLGSIPEGELGALFEQLWQSTFLVSNNIKARKWALMAIDGNEVFYLGDQPVVLQHVEKPSDALSLGFDVERVEAYLPFTPKLALYMPCAKTGAEIISGYELSAKLYRRAQEVMLIGDNLEEVNSMNMPLVKRIFFEHKSLYESLTAGSRFSSLAENIENLNYLQCSWAHQSIFSNTKDFSFAKTVFAKTPQYRGTMRTSVRELQEADFNHD
jgi:hypothetical protein